MTSDTLVTVHDVRVLRCDPDGPPLDGEAPALDLIGDALGRQIDLVAVPVERVPDVFFQLSSGVAGAVMQKFVNYGLRLAIVGDVTRHVAQSTALRALLHETNRGDHVWFVPSFDDLEAKLRPTG
jgi:hypothetical protein